MMCKENKGRIKRRKKHTNEIIKSSTPEVQQQIKCKEG